MLLDETIQPAFTLRHSVPQRDVPIIDWRAPTPPSIRATLERAILGLPFMSPSDRLTIWRPAFLNTHTQPTQAPIMPPNTASTEARTRRSASAEQRARFAARHAALHTQGAEVSAQMLAGSWNVLLVRKTADPERIHIYVQAPSTSAALMSRLWEAGLRIDGFDYDPYDASLHTIVRSTEQMPLVDQLIVWLGNYLAGTPHTGGPPSPYSLVPSASLVERISAFDSVVPAASTR